MLKSRNDLYRQVARIVAMVEERGGWRVVHPSWRLDEQALHQVAGSIAARRGLSLFGDPDAKGEWRAEMMYPFPQPRNPQPAVSYTPTLPQKEPRPAPLPPPTAEEQRAIEYKLNEACDEADMARLLRFVARSIMVRKEFLTDLDPLEIPKRIIAEMQAILLKTPKNTTPTDSGQLSLPFI